ncbi:MAG: hypothetical protein JW716_05540 [Candidatus Aenigmarchaeota archaeon]|nr:hypothetical protein [Candidatus Aenigmarchaeota archaeon]
MQNIIMLALLVFIILISGCTQAPVNDVTGISDSGESPAPEIIRVSEPVPNVVACPFERIEDPYPGECGRYTDQNKDGLCDLSQ